MILGFNPKPRTLAELMALINPEKAQQPEVVPAVLYSTRNWLAATTRLTFFDTNANVATADNVNNGQLPAPQFFVLERIFLSFLQPPTSHLGAGGAAATGLTGALHNLALLLNTGAMLFRFSISDKEYLRIPGRQIPQSGGPTGLWQLNSSNVAASVPESLQLANNGVPGVGGWPVNGMVVIPPQTNFTCSLEVSAAQAISATIPIAVEIYGSLYRRVL